MRLEVDTPPRLHRGMMTKFLMTRLPFTARVRLRRPTEAPLYLRGARRLSLRWSNGRRQSFACAGHVGALSFKNTDITFRGPDDGV